MKHGQAETVKVTFMGDNALLFFTYNVVVQYSMPSYHYKTFENKLNWKKNLASN